MSIQSGGMGDSEDEAPRRKDRKYKRDYDRKMTTRPSTQTIGEQFKVNKKPLRQKTVSSLMQKIYSLIPEK
jgi:hypothetical protein